MPEVFDVQDIVPKFLSFAAKGAYDHAKKQVAYACIINNYRQLASSSYESDE